MSAHADALSRRAAGDATPPVLPRRQRRGEVLRCDVLDKRAADLPRDGSIAVACELGDGLRRARARLVRRRRRACGVHAVIHHYCEIRLSRDELVEDGLPTPCVESVAS